MRHPLQGFFMRKNLKTWPLVFGVLIAVGLGYQSLFSKAIEGGMNWIRHLDSSYGEPGYHIHAEYAWQDINGFPTSVYVFESNELDSDGKHSILILLKDIEYNDKDRFLVPGGYRLVSSSLMGKDGKYLELINQTTPSIQGLVCQYVDLDSGAVLRNAHRVKFSRYSPPQPRVPQF